MTKYQQLKHQRCSAKCYFFVSIDTLQSAEAIDMAIMIVFLSLACPCSNCNLKI